MKKLFLLILIGALLHSCRVAKKDWVKENFSSIENVEQSFKAQDSIISQKVSKLETTVSKLETSVSKNETTSVSENESENTTVSGTITAEDGKEKTATIGNTVIKSNGANISFSTTSTKEISKAFESRYQELETRLDESLTELQTTKEELNSLKSEFANFRSTYESQRDEESGEITRRGLSFGSWITILIVLLVIGALWYFRNSISFLS